MTLNTAKRHQDNKKMVRLPQLRLTAQEVMSRRQMMRCDQYLADVLAAMKKVGFGFRIQVSKFAEKIGLSLRSFQRARKSLIEAGRLIENRINRDSIELFLVPESDKSDVQEDSGDVQGNNLDVQGDNADAVTCLEPVLGNSSESAPILNSTIHNNSLSVPIAEKREREIRQSGSTEIEPEYRVWLHAQALKMPRAIGNIEVWIRSVAKRPEWRDTFIEWVSKCQENNCSAALLTSSQEAYKIEINVPTEESLAAMKKARESLGFVPSLPAKSTRCQPLRESFKSLGLEKI
jgi:hypothetical protein